MSPPQVPVIVVVVSVVVKKFTVGVKISPETILFKVPLITTPSSTQVLSKTPGSLSLTPATSPFEV